MSGQSLSITQALAALGFNYYALGQLAGEMAVRILDGESPASIPVGRLETQDLYINPQAAEAMGVSIPEGILAAGKTPEEVAALAAAAVETTHGERHRVGDLLLQVGLQLLVYVLHLLIGDQAHR